MIDSFELLKPRIRDVRAPARLGLEKLGYGVVTLHRPLNVDAPEKLALIIEALEIIPERLRLVFPVHPRTRQRLEEFGLIDRLNAATAIRFVEPLSYIEFTSLVLDCRVAMTDSGGIQEEASYLGIPCLTVMDNTERPITVSEGTNLLVKASELTDAVGRVLAGPPRHSWRIDLWDGHTAARVADSLARHARLT